MGLLTSSTELAGENKKVAFYFKNLFIAAAALAVLAVLIWQAYAMGGNPDPATPNLSPTAMIVSTAVLVFREGLEAILVLAAITAGMVRGKQSEYIKAIPLGVGFGLLATLVTWFGVVAIISEVNLPELQVQAITGLLAIVVLIVIMNWFFHKFYWTGWISHHNSRKKALLENASKGIEPFWGLVFLGFTAIYREGFEIVLFLQNLRLRAGSLLVLEGASIGLALTVVVAVLTFIAHKKLPYKTMLVWTGILLGAVLLVMVGESVQEMQQAGWLNTTAIGLSIPAWMGLWFSVFPNVQGLAAQAVAAFVVIGSYFSAQYIKTGKHSAKTSDKAAA
jgi:high-affinity iron transporter